jgi:hypothetical protein
VSTEAEPSDGDRVYLATYCVEEDIPPKRRQLLQDVQMGWMIACATEMLYVLSGRQFRSGRSVVRPCAISSSYGTQSYLYPYSSMSGYGAAWGFAAGWSWTAVGMGWWQNGQDLSELLLQGPVTRINEVIVDGQSLGGWPPPNPNFTLYDGRRLVRNAVGGNPAASNSWPWNQQLQLPLTQGGTFAVDYEWGRKVPELGRAACVELAVNLGMVLTGDDSSKLPSRVLSVQTEGVSVAVGDPLTYVREDLTGLPICDQFLNTYNPAKLRRRSVFLSPNSVIGRSQPPAANPFGAY